MRDTTLYIGLHRGTITTATTTMATKKIPAKSPNKQCDQEKKYAKQIEIEKKALRKKETKLKMGAVKKYK